MNVREELIKLINSTDAEIFVEPFAATMFIGHSLRSFKRKVVSDHDPVFIENTKKVRNADDTDPILKTELLECIYFIGEYNDVVNIYDDANVIFFFSPEYITEEILQSLILIKGKVVVYDIQSDWISRRLHHWGIHYLDNGMAIYKNF